MTNWWEYTWWWEYPWWEGQGHSTPADWDGAPWDEWFYWYFDAYWTYTDIIPSGYYWMYRVSATEEHDSQIIIKQADGELLAYTLGGELPAFWGEADHIRLAPPCGNYSTIVTHTVVIRSQTCGLNAAIAGTPSLSPKIDAAIAVNSDLEPKTKAAIAADLDLPVYVNAAIQDDVDHSVYMRAAIQTTQDLEIGQDAAIGQDLELSVYAKAAIQGAPYLWYWQKAAIQGDTQLNYGMNAYIVVSRAEQIMLEMENLWPQEFAVPAPNWSSRTKDYRTDSLG